MKSVWGRMRVPVCVLILAACALADDNQERRSKLPFIADAVGNTLPPPSNVPATVGSPVNLLTPDRYEFYTFDESGELVKRLMTLEEIQAIVAAGEEAEGLVTFANDNQPTIAFNFSQPPYTKVHSVVTNVQNVLKAQMEIHKNKPQTQPPLDTPDVSDSWSLILPSIFGNTGVDIIPDKTSDSFITPETETIELDTSLFDDENSLGKEGVNLIPSSSTTEPFEVIDKKPTKEQLPERTNPSISISNTNTKKPITSTTTTITSTTPTTTPTPTTTTTTTTSTTTTTTPSPTTTTTTTTTTPTPSTTSTSTTTTTTTVKSTTAARRRVPSTTTTSTIKPRTTTTSTTTKPVATYISTTKTKPSISTTSRPIRTTFPPHRRTTTTTTVTVPSSETSTAAITTRRPVTSSKPFILDGSSEVPNTIPPSFGAVLDSRKPVQYEKISTFVPVSTITYITDKTTRTPITTTKKTPTILSTTQRIMSSSTADIPKAETTTITPHTTTYLTSAVNEQEYDKNSTTITTQSVSPSTTVSSTEIITINKQHNEQSMENQSQTQSESNGHDDNESSLPLFDVALSISQIASDLGGNFAPLPTPNNILDTTKTNNMGLESKENLEIEIPTDSDEQKLQNSTSSDNFIQISTLDPHEKNGNKTATEEDTRNNNLKDDHLHNESSTTSKTTTSTTTTPSTTIDPILSESMEDLLSQVVHSAPESIVNSNKNFETLKQENEQKIMENNINKQPVTVETTPELITKIELKENSMPIKAVQSIIKDNVDNEFHMHENNINKTELQQNESVRQDTNSKQSINETEENKIADTKNKTGIHDTDQLNKFEYTKKPFEQVSVTQPDLKNKTETEHTFSKKVVNNKYDSITSTESLIKLESATAKLGTTTRQQDSNVAFNVEKNKLSNASEKNRLPYTNPKDKEPVLFPKVDEFKKKIQKVNIDDKEFANERNNSWKLIPTVSPSKGSETGKDKHKTDDFNAPDINDEKNIILDFSKENQGLEVTTKDLGEDIAQFTELCNELAFQYWNDIVKDLDKKRSFVLSPYSITSMLAMMFMGARGSTSGEMNEILKLDDMVTFNPHFTIKNISDSIETSPGSGVAISAFIRELYSDRSKGKILTFYKERAQHFYNGHVEEINFKLISDIIRRRTNLLVKRYTWGKIIEYMKTNTIVMHPPLAAFSANIFQTDCSSSSVEGRDGEMYFVVSPNVRQRRLVPVPAVVYRSNFLAGYDPVLDATAAALGNTNSVISTLFLMPGQQGNVVHAEDLEALEKRLLDSNPITPTWNRLLRTLLPRMGLELQIPRFSHKSIFNVSSTLRHMGLRDLFDQEHADLGGLNGPSKNLYLSDMIQTSTFVTCGEGVIAELHHIEEYPESVDLVQKSRTARWVGGWDEPRDYQRAFHDPHDVGDAMHLPLHLRPRQARLPSRNAQPARLKFDRPFLFFVRHNPSGMILYVGRYNPRLLP